MVRSTDHRGDRSFSISVVSRTHHTTQASKTTQTNITINSSTMSYTVVFIVVCSVFCVPFVCVQVALRSKQTANALLRDLGVRAGEAVATLAWNSYRHLELYYAVVCFFHLSFHTSSTLFRCCACLSMDVCSLELVLFSTHWYVHTTNKETNAQNKHAKTHKQRTNKHLNKHTNEQNPRLFLEQLDYIVNHAQDTVIFVDVPFVPILEKIEVPLRFLVCLLFGVWSLVCILLFA